MKDLPSIETESRYCGISAENAAQYVRARREGRPMCIEAGTDIDHLESDDFPFIGTARPKELDIVTLWFFTPDNPVGELERFRRILRSQFKTAPWYCYARVYNNRAEIRTIGVFQPIPS